MKKEKIEKGEKKIRIGPHYTRQVTCVPNIRQMRDYWEDPKEIRRKGSWRQSVISSSPPTPDYRYRERCTVTDERTEHASFVVDWIVPGAWFGPELLRNGSNYFNVFTPMVPVVVSRHELSWHLVRNISKTMAFSCLCNNSKEVPSFQE